VQTTLYIYIDDSNNVICNSIFIVTIGRIEGSNFIPSGDLVLEQGLTPQMLMMIAELIREKLDIV
jgi:hypothetical protein